VKDLMETVRLRWKAESLGIEKLVLKGNQMKCYLLPSSRDDFYSSEAFGKIMKYAQIHHKACKIKEHKNRLIVTIEGIPSIQKSQKVLEDMKSQVLTKP
jgi:transcription-repair coupling factor (superfamily II helicase)